MVQPEHKVSRGKAYIINEACLYKAGKFYCIWQVHCNSHGDPINCIRTINSVTGIFEI